MSYTKSHSPYMAVFKSRPSQSGAPLQPATKVPALSFHLTHSPRTVAPPGPFAPFFWFPVILVWRCLLTGIYSSISRAQLLLQPCLRQKTLLLACILPVSIRKTSHWNPTNASPASYLTQEEFLEGKRKKFPFSFDIYPQEPPDMYENLSLKL